MYPFLCNISHFPFSFYIFFLHVVDYDVQAVQKYSKQRASSLPYSPSVDAVLITKADLEGYHSTCHAGMELAIVPKVPKKTLPMIARLSCLFTSLKVSGSSVPPSRRLPVSEALAC